MKLTLRSIVKSITVILIFIFIGPSLLSFLTSDSKEESPPRRLRSNQNHGGDDTGANFEQNMIPPHNPKKPLAAPAGLQDNHVAGRLGAGPDTNQEQLGRPQPDKSATVPPTATLKEGILGNFEPVIKLVNGPGENGEPVYYSTDEEREVRKQTQMYGFNMVVSDKISLNRTIPDTRLDECKYWHYPEDLPTASVILVFHNEGWSTLLRTVHSVINTSPKHLLHEIVMVDDYSDKPHLKQPLDEYVKQFNGLVKIFRNEKREGLINTRTIGARHSTGDVIIFLDAHCECNRNWLVPLLARIRYNRKIMAVPTIDGIDYNTFRISSVYGHGQHYRGIFEWGFLYKESAVPQKELERRKYHSEPYRAPTHAGGLFAMDRKYFFELGAYDDGLLIWGGENFELSFKIWQCGGEIEWVPCSKVAHVYRNHMPYGFGNINTKIPIIQVNYMRVVEVWLDDEFKEYFYTREPSVRGYDYGDISKQIKFKRDNNCKSFQWYMSNIAYEVYDRFPPPPKNQYWGQVREEQGTQCWDSMGFGVGRQVEVHHCHKLGGSQLLRLNVEGQLASGERCLVPRGGHVEVIVCPIEPTGDWEYLKDTKQLRDKNSGKCAGLPNNDRKLDMQTCDRQAQNQKFVFEEVRQF